MIRISAVYVKSDRQIPYPIGDEIWKPIVENGERRTASFMRTEDVYRGFGLEYKYRRMDTYE